MSLPLQKLAPVVRFERVRLRYGKTVALDGITADIPAAAMVGLIGPDAVGKSSLLSLIAGARAVQEGRVMTLEGDMADPRHRRAVCRRIAYMPQGLGRNLYPTLSIEENLQFFGCLFGLEQAERRRRIDGLCRDTGLSDFLARPVGQLSGGMKQKLGLCCALIHDPDLLVLDEPTTGVDPLARSQFWDLIRRLRVARPGMSVVVATAYMEEAEQFEWLMAMNAGRILASGSPAQLRNQTHTDSLDAAFIALLPEALRSRHRPVTIPAFKEAAGSGFAIDARELTKKFGAFVAVNRVSFQIRRGEIFGFLGSNGCGKSTTMKMLTGLLPPTSGVAQLFGLPVRVDDLATRRRVGYMSQSFSLYSELSIHQNLVLAARLYGMDPAQISSRVDEMVLRFDLERNRDSMPDQLPLGIRQRLSLAVAMVHQPELLILDEPTSGVDPIARDVLWQLMIDLSRKDEVTIFVSTHFMNEAMRCDRISLMNAGSVLVTGRPEEIVRLRGSASLEEAFISYLKEAEGISAPAGHPSEPQNPVGVISATTPAPVRRTPPFSIRRSWSYTLREARELRRDPVRLTMALLGTALLMLIIGYGISLDVENLDFAVLDHDGTGLSRDYALNLAGSRYFHEAHPLRDDRDLERRMRSGELALAIDIPPHFARSIGHGNPVSVGAWVDGSMPQRAETIQGYIQGMHQGWLEEMATRRLGQNHPSPAWVETRYRYNPDVRSLPAMVPSVIPLLLLLIPAMLTALSVVREKELGSIINLYVTPVTRSEFLLGKQLPYVVLSLLNFSLLTLMAVGLFRVPVKGSLAALSTGALLFVIFSTGFGLFCSTFTRSQIAALFLTLIGTLIPAVQFAGILSPVSSLEGMGAVIGKSYPATHFLLICRGVFSKGLGFRGLAASFWPLLLAVPVMVGLPILLLRKQET